MVVGIAEGVALLAALLSIPYWVGRHDRLKREKALLNEIKGRWSL